MKVIFVILLIIAICMYFINNTSLINQNSIDEYFYNSPNTKLALAIVENDTNKLKSLLINTTKGVINHQLKKRDGITVLGWSIKYGYYNSIDILLNYGANPNIKDYNDVTPVIYAASIKNDSLILKKLIKHGGDINVIAKKTTSLCDKTPFLAACSSSLYNVKLLVSLGVNPHYLYNNDSGYNPLEAAYIGGNIEIMKYLMFDLNINYKYEINYTHSGSGTKTNILSNLRRMVYDLNSPEYKIKMEIVKMLKENGLNYWSEPIPSYYFNNYDGDYLSKY